MWMFTLQAEIIELRSIRQTTTYFYGKLARLRLNNWNYMNKGTQQFPSSFSLSLPLFVVPILLSDNIVHNAYQHTHMPTLV